MRGKALLKMLKKNMSFFVFSLVYIFFLIPHKTFLRKDYKNLVGFASGFFNGNIKYLYQQVKTHADIKVFFVTGNISELSRLKSSNIQAYYYMDMHCIPLFLKTKVWVTSHGPANIPFIGAICTISQRMNAQFIVIPLRFFLYFWTKTRNDKWVDVWHGLEFKHTERAKMLADYDVGFVTSTFFKTHYSEKTGISDKLIVAGYPRTDPLITKAWDRQRILKMLGVSPNKRNILYAPTYGYRWRNRFFPWGNMDSIIDKIEEFCERNNCNFLIRMHPLWYNRNALSKEKLRERVAQSKQIFHLPSNLYVDVEPILFASDVLITGWSSIANDFILLDRPIIFLDVELPTKKFVLKPEDRVGFIATNETEFFEKLEKALLRPRLFREKRQTLIKKLYNQLDGNSSKRCAQIIAKLVKQQV